MVPEHGEKECLCRQEPRPWPSPSFRRLASLSSGLIYGDDRFGLHSWEGPGAKEMEQTSQEAVPSSSGNQGTKVQPRLMN